MYEYCVSNGVIPDYGTGEVVAYAQPVIGVEMLKNGIWEVTDTNIRSIETWKSVCDWKGVSTFKNFYNKEVKVRVSCGLNVSIGGSSEVSRQQRGAVRQLAENGILPINVDPTTGTFTLSAITIDGVQNRDGTVSSYKVALDLDARAPDGTYSLTSDSNLIDASGNDVIFSSEGFIFTEERSGLYELISTTKIRYGENTTITCSYSRERKETVAIGRQNFFVGSDRPLGMVLGNEHSINFDSEHGMISKSLDDWGVPITTTYLGSNKWQLDGICIGLGVNGTSGDLVALQNQEIIESFGVISQSTSAWQSKVFSNSPVGVTVDYGEDLYIVQGSYVMYAPQVELKYFRDEDGGLHLLSATSGGESYSDLDGMLRNTYGSSGSKYTFERFCPDITTQKGKKDLVLTKAYAYAGPGVIRS